jgi:DNA-binding XRE family transcriptional regulator
MTTTTSLVPGSSPARPLRSPGGPPRLDAYVIDNTRLRELRREHGLSQEQLAWKSGVGLTTLGNLERTHQPRCRTWTLTRLAAVLGPGTDKLILQAIRYDNRHLRTAAPAPDNPTAQRHNTTGGKRHPPDARRAGAGQISAAR